MRRTTMRSCPSCSSELPTDARFCGQCGYVIDITTEVPTSISEVPTVRDFPIDNLLSSGAPTAISNPSHPTQVNGVRKGAEQELPGGTVRDDWSQAARFGNITSTQGEAEEEQRRPVLSELPLLGALAAEGQAPFVHLPMVQGTPQVSGIPMVQGTPSLSSGGGATGPGVSQGALSSSSSVTPSGPHPPATHAPPTHPIHPPTHPTPSPGSHPHGCAMRWFIASFAIVVIIASIFTGFFFVFSPAISLSGSSTVTL